ncbi:hypothetical protein JH146_1436 [Methanocaldococcus bathoardescens]|uniref:Uncharacterized protein n=1 Tax=Methanocaldococcus bathoardescens TaxID=1301915 RepID=A0A076LIG6_9EURY|nr:hypothetical protein [Methanocaldococcus bathoardescens]AIJ06278.1 hypothetical protein JH146_1436 [Methanocaldococcus bathoardescens]
MEEKIILSIQNPESVLISYVDIYLGDKNVSLEVLSKDTAKINLPFDKDEGEGEIVVKIRYKTLPNHKNKDKKEVKKQDYKNLSSNFNKITKKTNDRKNNDIIVADSKPISLEELKKEEKKRKLSNIIIV